MFVVRLMKEILLVKHVRGQTYDRNPISEIHEIPSS